MASKFVVLVMLLLVALMVPTYAHPGKSIEEVSIECGDRCLLEYEAKFQIADAYAVYKQCISDCNDFFSDDK